MISKFPDHCCKVYVAVSWAPITLLTFGYIRFVVAGEASNLSKTPEHLRTYKSAKFVNVDKFVDIRRGRYILALQLRHQERRGLGEAAQLE